MGEYKQIFQKLLQEQNPLKLHALASIFEQLSIKAPYEAKNKTYFYEANCLPDFIEDTSPSFFAQKDIKWDCTALLEEIKTNYKIIAGVIEDNYTYYHLAYKYLSRITDKELDVVSLFDKYRIDRAKDNLKDASQYLLVKGDFSGMQKFIYGGINTSESGQTKGLSKKLRGRSFYITVMSDMVAETFAEELGLGIENVIYSGGGHFLLLCKDGSESKNKIKELTQKINEFLLKNVGSDLSFITGQAACGVEIFEDASQAMMEVNFDLSGKKNKMYQQNLADIFTEDHEPGFGKKNLKTKNKNDKSYDERIGDLLPKMNAIIELTLSKEWNKKKIEEYIQLQKNKYVACEVFALNKVLIMVEKVGKKDLIDLLTMYQNMVDAVKIIRINENTHFLDNYVAIHQACQNLNIKVGFGFRYIGNHTPVVNGNTNIADFSEIIRLNQFPKESYFDAIPYPNENENSASFQPWGNTFETNYLTKPLSYPKLAVMRLDVDNLGTIFGFGMGDTTSLTQTATLSRELHLFFTGYFSVLAKKYDLYITYSGGDDAFVVGSWIGIAHFAKELYHQFKKFVCHNSEITFSAGVFLCDEHYPVAKFAFDAAELEKRAKHFPNKNAITIFDHTLSFPHYDAMLNFSVKMLGYVRTDDEKADKGKIARSLVHRLLRIVKSCMNDKNDPSFKVDKMYRQTANLHYLFARQGFNAQEIELAKANDAKAKAITKDIMEVVLSHFKAGDANQLVPNFLIPTNYVTLLTRKENEFINSNYSGLK